MQMPVKIFCSLHGMGTYAAFFVFSRTDFTFWLCIAFVWHGTCFLSGRRRTMEQHFNDRWMIDFYCCDVRLEMAWASTVGGIAAC